MRVIYLHQYFNTPEQNGSTRSYEFARRMAQRGHDVHVVTTDRSLPATPGWSHLRLDGIHVHQLAVPYNNRMSTLERIRAFVVFALRAGSKARKLAGDVILATSTPLTIFLPAWQAAFARKTPIIFEVRDSWPTVPIALGYLKSKPAQWAARWLERTAYRKSAHVITLSPGMRDDALAHGAAPEQITVVPNACDLELFDVPAERGAAWRSENGIPANAPMVLYSGTFGAANDVEYLVDLAAATARVSPDTIFVLIGTGAEEEKIRSRAQELGLLGNVVRILPPVPKSEMPLVLSASTIATSVVTDNPAMNANSANKFFDALAAERPIVINHEGWQADLIRQHNVGLVLDRHRPERAVKQLLDVLTNEDQVRTMSRNAKRLAVSEFSRDGLSERFINVIENAGAGALPPR